MEIHQIVAPELVIRQKWVDDFAAALNQKIAGANVNIQPTAERS